MQRAWCCSRNWVEAVAVGTGSHPEQPAVVFIRLPGQQGRVFRQQLPQSFDVVVMNDAAGFGYGPLESLTEALFDFFDKVLRAWQIHIRARAPVGHHAVTTAARLLAAAHAPGRWRLHYRRQCRAPVSLLACEGIQGKDEQEVSICSRQSPFMSACDPLIQAERRFKARCLNRSRWDCSLAASRGCPVARWTEYRLLERHGQTEICETSRTRGRHEYKSRLAFRKPFGEWPEATWRYNARSVDVPSGSR